MRLAKIKSLVLAFVIGIGISMGSSATLAFSSVSGFGVFPNTSQVLDYVHHEFAKKNYDIDKENLNVVVKYLVDWPEKVRKGLANELNQDGFEISDKDNVGARIVFADPSGEFVLDGSIIRSLEIKTEDGELVYVVAYKTWGGEWGRKTGYRFYYIFDQDGNILKNVVFH